LWDKAQIITSSFSAMENLTVENVDQAISVLGDLNVTRIVVVDGESELLYDSAPQEETKRMKAEVEQALNGWDVFYCHYGKGVLQSHAAVPIMRGDRPLGCVYIYDCDEEQGAIIQALEANILRISVAVEAVLVLFSAGFAVASSMKMRKILDTMQKTRAGEYEHKIELHGTDEYAVLARDFNKLTDRLQASEQTQKQFVSDASHELKTPLASIKLLSDSILQNDMDAQTMREFVADIGNEADRLVRLTQELLVMSKAELTERDHEIVDLAQVVSKVFKMLVSVADVRNIRLTCNMEGSCMVLTAEDDMYQIIFNLVENAIKYNRDEGRVHVDLKCVEEDVVLTVEDTGIGIPEEAMEHIFERFYRVDKARSRAAGGSGLGLSIVQELVERNYGQISVAPREPEGTRFTLVLPCFNVELDEDRDEMEQ